MRIKPPHGLARRITRLVPAYAMNAMFAAFLLVIFLSAQAIVGQRKPPALDGVRGPSSGALTGFAFVNLGNAVTLGRSSAPPVGARAAAGATVSVGSVSAKTNSAGAFTLKSIPAGVGVFHVATEGGPVGDFPVTIFGGATAKLGAPAVTRAAALSTVISALSLITKDPNGTIVIGPQEPLPVGTTVGPVYGDDDGQPSAVLNYAVRTEQWFIYVDPDATARYQHPVEFFFVDASTGALTKLDETSWPFINGLSYYGSRDADVKSPDLMGGPTLPSGPKSAASEPAPRAQAVVMRAIGDSVSARTLESTDQRISAHVLLASLLAAPSRSPGLNFMARAAAPRAQTAVTPVGGGTTYGLIIQGADESDENADVQNITGLFGHGGIPPASVRFSKPSDSVGLNGPGRSPRMDEVQAEFQQQCMAAQPNDTLFIYITGHGLKNGGVQLDSNGVEKSGDPVTFETLTASRFDFSKCKACRIIIIIDACYSGKMASQFNDVLKKEECVNYTIISSTDSTHYSRAYPSWDFRGPTGGFFTNKFISAFNDQVAANPAGTVDLAQGFQTAKDTLNSSWRSGVSAQNPQIYVHNAPEGCPCGPHRTTSNVTGRPATDQPGPVPPPKTGGGTLIPPAPSSNSVGTNPAPGAPSQRPETPPSGSQPHQTQPSTTVPRANTPAKESVGGSATGQPSTQPSTPPNSTPGANNPPAKTTPNDATGPKSGESSLPSLSPSPASMMIRGIVLPRSASHDEVSGLGVSDPERYANIPGLQVVPVPAAGTASLHGEVIDMGDGRKQRADGPVTANVYAEATSIPVRVFDADQPSQPIAQATLSVERSAVPPETAPPAPSDCTMPPIATAGAVEVIHVTSNQASGDSTQMSVLVDDKPATIVAAKPGSVFWNVPDTLTPGPHQVQFIPKRDVPPVALPMYVLGLQMSAESTSMIRGQSTTMHVAITGLENLPSSVWRSALPSSDLVDVAGIEQRAKGFRAPKPQEPGTVLLLLENHSPSQIRMGKAGDRIVLELHQRDFANGPYTYQDKLQSLSSGGFDISGTVVAFLKEGHGSD